MDTSGFVISTDSPINKLECREAFQGLTDREKYYSHYLSRAGWDGGLICLLQTSPESAPIFLLLKEVFSRQSVKSLREATRESVRESEFQVNVFPHSFMYTLVVHWFSSKRTFSYSCQYNLLGPNCCIFVS